jgi:hypothetical protein
MSQQGVQAELFAGEMTAYQQRTETSSLAQVAYLLLL